MLAQRLRQVKRDGLVERTYHAEGPARVDYRISELERSLAPLFSGLVTWSEEHLDQVETAHFSYDK